MILINLKEFLAKNKKIFYYISLFFIVSFFTSSATFAASGDTTTAQTIATGANTLMKFISLFLGLLSYLATMFLSPDWLNGTLFGMNTKFKEIWIMVSNLVYFVFAFILIWIAFMNIIGKNTETYQLKQALPKFIVGVLIVPFSWFIVQFILSLSAILTVSAITLPYDTFPDYATAIDKVGIPKDCTLDLNKDLKEKEYLNCSDDKVPLGNILGNGSASDSIYGVLSFYTYGVIGMSDVDTVPFDSTNPESYKTLADIAFKLVFDVLFVAIYFILIVALGLVLMIRGIYLWIYIMLSPVFGLMYFFNKKDGGGDGFFAKFNIKEFIALAMVPVYTMLALSFGMLFIYIVGVGLTEDSGTGAVTSKSFSVTNLDGGGSSISVGKNENMVTYTIKGATGTASNNLKEMMKSSGNKVLGVIGMLILKLFGIVVLWGTVMAAMRTSTITKAIVEPLYQFGTKVGGIVSSAPGNIPVFGGQSATGLSSAAGSFKSSIDSHFTSKGAAFGQSISPFAKTDSSDMKLVNSKHSEVSSPIQGKTYEKEMSSYISDLNKTLRNTSSRTELMEMIKKIYGNKVYDKVKDSSNKADFYTKFIQSINDRDATGAGELMINKNKGLYTNKESFYKIFEGGGTSSGDADRTNGSSIQKPNIDQHDKTIRFGTAVMNIELNSDDKVTDLKTAKAELAKYIANNLLNTTQLNDLISHLNLSDEAVKQLDRYFKKDSKGHIILDNSGTGTGTSIEDFAKSNNS